MNYLHFSGAEDMHAYVWDRYYGMCLAKYPHIDVVNSVAFNPRDTEMLVTTSDDYSIKVSSMNLNDLSCLSSRFMKYNFIWGYIFGI